MTQTAVNAAFILDAGALEEETLFLRALSLCPETRQNKALSYKNTKDRRLSVAAWLCLRRALAPRGIDAGRVRIGYAPGGKPYLAEHPQIRFNLSHSGSMAFCIVSGYEAGCDIETEGKIDLKLAARCFHPDEVRVLKSSPDLLTRVWTRKESVIKCSGEGLARPLGSFSVFSEGRLLPAVTLGNKNYSLYELAVPGNYRAACCLKTPFGVRPSVSCEEIAIEDALTEKLT